MSDNCIDIIFKSTKAQLHILPTSEASDIIRKVRFSYRPTPVEEHRNDIKPTTECLSDFMANPVIRSIDKPLTRQAGSIRQPVRSNDD
ncbi:hypothetical protein JCM9534A_36160 [Catenuloplanes indicus JCM 9534]